MSFNNKEYEYTHITTAKTSQIATGKGTLGFITFNTPTVGTVTIIDGITGTTGNVAVITPAVGEPFTLIYNTTFGTGLRVITSATIDITVAWTQS